jgi:probable rRNA maturation factor
MLEVEVFGADLIPDGPPPDEARRLCALAAAAAGVRDGHLAIEFVDGARIAQLNAEHRGKQGPTDVLSFPIDGAVAQGSAALREGTAQCDAATPIGHAAHHGVAPDDALQDGDQAQPQGPERELGDVVICPEHTSDLREAIVHGVLHLVGFDHERDDGEMLALQARLLAEEAR